MAASRKAARSGDLSRALTHAFIAVKHEPRAFEPLFLLAAALQRVNRVADAIPYYERALQLDDSLPEPHHNLGCALLVVGRTAEAVASLRRALALRPDYAEALDALGFATAELGEPHEAAALLERSLALDARNPTVHGRLGHVLLRLGRFAEAHARFSAGLQRAPASSELLDGCGIALDRLERTPEAIAAFRAALAADPANANAACNLGKTLLEVGDVAEAMTWFDRAIELEPRNGSFYLPLVTGGSLGVKPEHVAAMQRLAPDIAQLPLAQQIDLHFALGNVYERAGRYDDAFHHLFAGNTLKRATIAYDEPAALEYVRTTEAAFANPLMGELRGCGDPSERPIFIVGMPRSGSTLVEQLLAAHLDVADAGECGILGPIVREEWPKIAATTMDALRAQIRGIGERYLRETDALASGKARLTDKTLENLQLAPLIHVTLPNARIIHIRRDDLDACFSCYATFFADQKVPFAYDLRELGNYYRGYLRMMERWSAFVLPDRMIEVRYERLVADFESEARRIVAFCGLAWDPAALAFYDVRRAVRTASNLQVRQPLYASSVGRAERFRPHLEPLIAALSS